MKTNSPNPSPSTDQILFLLRRIIREITTEPNKTITRAESIGYSTVGIEIDAWPPDYGKILGGGGTRDHLGAMKMICKLISDRTGKSIELSLKRIPMESATAPALMKDFEPVEDWRKNHIHALTEDIFTMIIPSPFKVIVTDGKQGKTAVDVIIGSDVAPATVRWINIKLQPLYKSMGLKNGRIIAFNLIQDDAALNDVMRRAAATA